MQRPTLPSMLLCLALAGCSADSTTDPVSLNHDMVPTPFVGHCELITQPPQPISPGVVSRVNTGDCILTHLGKSTYHSINVIDLATGTQTIQATYTAANGALLYANGNGTNQFVGPGRVAFQAQVTFDGGTGRFADATGSTTIAGTADVVNQTAQFTSAGTIAY